MALVIAVRLEPAAVAWVPVIVMPERTAVLTAYWSVALTKTAQATSSRTNVRHIIGRNVNVNSSSSAPLVRERRDRGIETIGVTLPSHEYGIPRSFSISQNDNRYTHHPRT